MKKVALLHLMVCLGLISGVILPAGAADSSRGFAFTDKVVLAYYYIWFNEDCQLADFMKTMRGHIDEYNKTQGFKNGKPAQHHATISPGYDETRNPGRKTRNGGFKGAGWKDRTKFGVNYPDDPDGAYYRGTFEAAMSSNPDWRHISTFNELAEFSHIEATFEHGYTYIDLTAQFVREFKSRK